VNILDFLKYWLDTHPIMFGTVVILLALGFASMLGKMFSKGDKDE
jgi:ABC-type uncharacterized transport system permease subunit